MVGNLEGKRPLKRPRHTWEDNVETGHTEEIACVYWIHLAQD
jgi:hypothetical protein